MMELLYTSNFFFLFISKEVSPIESSDNAGSISIGYELWDATSCQLLQSLLVLRLSL